MFKWLLKLAGFSWELPTVGKYYQSKKGSKDPFSKEQVMYVISVKDNYVQYQYYSAPYKTLSDNKRSLSVLDFNMVYVQTDKIFELKEQS